MFKCVHNVVKVCDNPDPETSTGAILTTTLLSILGVCVITGTAVDALRKDSSNDEPAAPPKTSDGIHTHGSGPTPATLKRLVGAGEIFGVKIIRAPSLLRKFRTL